MTPTLEVRQDDGSWRLLNPEQSNSGFSELADAVFRFTPTDGNRLLLDDAPLPAGDEGEWRWRPGFYAGEVRAEIVDTAGATLAIWPLEVRSPDPKPGPSVFRRMVEEIIEYDPALVLGTEPARRRLGTLGESENPLVALERLRRREEQLNRAITAIHQEPRSILRARREWTPLHRVRRADLRTLRTAAREPAVVAALRRTESAEHAAPASERVFLDTPAAEHSLDSPANRAALFMLRALRRRAAAVRKKLDEAVRKEHASDTRTGLGERWPRYREVLDRMATRFERAERRSPFRDARRPETTAAGLNAIAADPVYSRFWRLAWEALRPGILGPQDAEELPLSPSWEIYERWCFVELARHLRTRLPAPDWTESRQAGSADRRSIRWSRPNDAASIELFLQRTANRTTNGLRSVSKELVPDLVLRWENVAGETGFMPLDAKYRARRPNILSGMVESAHVYQDALRWNNHRPAATLLLVPDVTEAAFLSKLDFVATNWVGAITLRPDIPPPNWFWSLLPDPLRAGP